MAWEIGTARYRGRADASQFEITDNKNGTVMAEGFLECTAGPQAGQRIKYRGFISGPGGVPSEKNALATSEELRAMGARLVRGWKDLGGLGTREVEFTVFADENGGKTYYRAAFVRKPVCINRDRVVSDDALDMLPPPPAESASNGANGHRLPERAGVDDEAADPGEDADFP